MKKKLFAIMLIALACVVSTPREHSRTGQAFAQGKNTVHFFYGKGCPHCEQVEGYLRQYTRQFNLDVKRYEVWYDTANRNKLIAMAKERGKSVNGVPTLIAGREVYTGSNQAKVEGFLRKAGRSK